MNKPLEIRLAVRTDLASITRCAEAAYEKYIERIGRKPTPMVADFQGQIKQRKVHVLTVENSLCGFAVCYPCDDAWFLENIAVDPACQSRGYGAHLLEYVHHLAADFDIIRLYTNAKMTENLGWYRSHGYKEIDRRIEDGFARVYFEKML